MKKAIIIIQLILLSGLIYLVYQSWNGYVLTKNDMIYVGSVMLFNVVINIIAPRLMKSNSKMDR